MMKSLLISLLLCLALLLPAPSWANRLFTCGYEENDLTSTMWTATVGTAPTIGSTSPHSGTYRMNSGSNAGTSYIRYAFTAKTSGSLYSRVYWRTSATPSATIQVMGMWSAALVGAFSVSEVATTGVLRLTNIVSGTTTDSTTVISVNTWYRLETEVVLSDTVGSVTLRIYDDSLNLLETLTITGEDTLPTNISGIYVGKASGTQTAIFSYDDIGINDSSGSVQTSWLGAGKIHLLVPDSDVAIMWEKNGGTANDATFAQIDDLPGTPNDADYNTADPLIDLNDTLANDPIDQFGLTNPVAEMTSDATITLIAVYSRCGSNQTSAAHIKYKLWDDVSALTTGPTVNCNVNGLTHLTSDAEVLVYDAVGNTKTKTNLNTFNVGYEVVTDTLVARPRLISALWAEVEWTEAIASTQATYSHRGFMGVMK